ncbi:uncharacterized protein LOC118419790 [Branchiostoma floridae]|uniref:Uncharacterized protein LOC118419790 n=1 Tax=Branchiostoma floridae TaxID=7739 RepID=A0A9J7LGB1_BRAFL|nr:uncharacterized protein LOC118419790 [Branchiostoma floridae]
MAPMNTTMVPTTQTTDVMTTAAAGPRSWRVTFDANCTVALTNKVEFLQNCSVECAQWLSANESTVRCVDVLCGSTIVVVEVDPSANQTAVAEKFENLNDPNSTEPLMFSFGGSTFAAASSEIVQPPTAAPETPGTTTTSPKPAGSFCMIRGLDYTGCVIFLSCVIAIGVILLVAILCCIVRCCRRQKSKSFDLLSDIPHISLSDYPMTTIPRPSVYQHGSGNPGQVNMAYITDDDLDKPKQPLESSNTSQSSHSSGRAEDEKNTSALNDSGSNHVVQQASGASYQAVATEDQPPPVYSPQSGTNGVVVQATGTDQAPGPLPPSSASPVTEDLLAQIPETVDTSEVPESENPTISFREAPDAQDDPESPAPASPKVIKGEDGSVSVVVNW